MIRTRMQGLQALGCLGLLATVAACSPVRQSATAPQEIDMRAHAQQSTLRIGAASSVVTPPVGAFIAGDRQDRRFTGIHDDLYAKAVVFDDGVTPLALVVVDCIGLHYPVVLKIREAAMKRVEGIALAPERIIVQATHTHGGPDVIGLWGPDAATSGVDPAYMARLVDTAAEQVARAAVARRPASIRFAQGESGEGWVVNDSEPGEVDRSLVVFQCLDASGMSLATLTSFACHPTCIDGTVSEVSADFVGAFYAEMANVFPGEHLFLQGPVGGWIQPVTPERTFALAQDYGKRFAADVVQALDSAKPLEGTRIRFTRNVFEIPVENEGFQQMSATGIVDRPITETVTTEVAWFAIGPAQFATHPGETSPHHGWKTKEMMDSGPKVVLGLGLDELGYILKTEYFEGGAIPHAEYLISMSPGRAAGPAVLAALEAVIP